MPTASAPTWISAFLDFAPDHAETGPAFWAAVTAYDVSAPRGSHGEFASLLPSGGAAHVRVQRLAAGSDRIHLDLHVGDPAAAAATATELGATLVADDEVVVMASPGGLAFCLVDVGAGVVAAPTTWPDGHDSVLDQVCLDVPRAAYGQECAFWAGLTGWERRPPQVHEAFSSLARPAGQPLRLLFQRLDEAGGPARAHVDWATTDRPLEVARHRGLGARVLEEFRWWTVMADPVGRAYCITDRDPATGVLPVPETQ
ncbi:hypothetical protein KUV85_00225 [Nocardioides panacisoli]|uniref:VOC family protein n=1 Tax=Nocardioides panacisoli TaxID=627624 RepID=UPI001C631DD3|nr:VOC family protein [Nocardioides panacisoli]QYJ04140.1 hypothetical protein KUV85_00225 [Nocardioides panacisoli]